jgi:hypothetical protein
MSYLTHQKFSVPINRDQVAQDWHSRGYSCDVFVDPPGREWNNFSYASRRCFVPFPLINIRPYYPQAFPSP